jgi:hypothetical protein
MMKFIQYLWYYYWYLLYRFTRWYFDTLNHSGNYVYYLPIQKEIAFFQGVLVYNSCNKQ